VEPIRDPFQGGGVIMLELIALGGLLVFVLGVLVGVRCQEINLRRRERRLIDEKRRLNEQILSLTYDWT
jgi:hypothetical protein